MAPDFAVTGNAQAIDLICRRYAVGSPSQYLRQVKTIAEVQLDYAIARHYRDEAVSASMRGLEEELRTLPPDSPAEVAQMVVMQWLVATTSSN